MKNLLIETAAHETGHAVMRKICGLQATAIWASESGDGFCEGDGTLITQEAKLLISLAGPVAEIGCIVAWCNWENSHSDDLDCARQIIESHEIFRLKFYQSTSSLVPISPREALIMHLNRAADMLAEHSELITDIADKLIEQGGQLSAQEVEDCLVEVKMRLNGQR